MPVDNNFEIKINKSSVLRSLGYVNFDRIPKDILNEIDEIMPQAIAKVKPQVLYKKVGFKIDYGKNEVTVDGGYTFHGNYLVKNIKGADYLVVVLSSIGSEIDEMCNMYFGSGDYLKGMIYDSIGALALNDLNRKFWLKLVDEAKGANMGITHRLSPGHNDWNISDQKVIFSVLDANEIGVTLSDSYMMTPLKTLSVIYGIGKGMPISKVDHDCVDCDMENCSMRVMPKYKEQDTYNINVNAIDDIKTFQIQKGSRLWDALKDNRINIRQICDGRHTCGKCKVIVKPKENAGDLSYEERNFLTEDEIENGIRLACFLEPRGDIEIQLLNINDEAQVLTDGFINVKEIKPRVKINYISKRDKLGHLKFIEPSINDQRDDFERINSLLNNDLNTNLKASISVLNKIETITRNNEDFCMITRGNEILDCNNKENSVFGVAVDIGTTTIAAYLMNLSNGEQLDVYSSLNPQKIYGSDVITRINHIINSQDRFGLKELHKLIIDELNKIIDYFAKNNRIEFCDIYEITVVGNTTMMHLFAGVNPENIANAPYIPAYTNSLEIKAKEMNININPEGYIIMLPMVSGYIGADTIAAVMASGMHESDEIGLLLDIGTNGEIVLGNRNRMLSCSAAAGPAFEGAKITFGTGGIKGAINHVDLDNDPIYTTIGEEQPLGICGSGIVDIISEMLCHGIINTTGRMTKADGRFNDRMTDYKGQRAFIIDNNTGIMLTQQDVRELQLAKGAIAAGINVLMMKYGIEAEKIDKVYFAGGFGNYLNIKSAINIGLVPKILKDKIIQIGNGAGTGAKMALISDNCLKHANELRKTIEYVELSKIPEFQDEFMDSMYFNEV